MNRSFIILQLVLGLLAPLQLARTQAFWNLPMDPDPMAGYVYGGNVTWVEGSTVMTDSIVWTMRVLDAIERGTIRAWKVSGHPMDLAWYKPGMKPITRTIVDVAGKAFYVTAADVYERIENKNDELRDLVWESELALGLPLSKGRAFGESQHLRRSDGMYVWRVEEIEPVDDTRNSEAVDDYVYTVVYRAKNSVILTEWRKAVGLVRYRYRHQGASTDCDVRFERTVGNVTFRAPD